MPQLIITQTFENTAIDLIDFFTRWSDENKAVEKIENVIERFESAVLNNPETYPICPDIKEYFGIIDYRIFKLDGIKIIYRYEQSNSIVYCMLMLSDKQDMKKALINHCLVHK